jgi:hypothetical protein
MVFQPDPYSTMRFAIIRLVLDEVTSKTLKLTTDPHAHYPKLDMLPGNGTTLTLSV